MNRRDFFTKMGLTAAAVTIAPEVIKALPRHQPKVIAGVDPAMGPEGKVYGVHVNDMPSGMTIKDFMDIYHRHGLIIYEDRKRNADYELQKRMDEEFLSN